MLHRKDKREGDDYPEWLVDGFNEVVNETGLIDMHLSEHQYT